MAKGKEIVLPPINDELRHSLTDPRSDFTAEDRIAVAMCFLLDGGNATKAAKRAEVMLGREVKPETLRQWRRRAWWHEAEDYAKHFLQKDLEARYTQFIHKTEEQMLDRVLNGEERITKDGSIIRVKPSLRDLTGAHAIITDKRAMIRGEPTQRNEDTGTKLLGKLVEELQKRGKEKIKDSIDGNYKVIKER